MKIHQLARDLISWDQVDTPSLSCNKRLRPLAPKLPDTSPLTTVDLKTFIRPQTGSVASTTTNDPSPHPKSQVDTHPGGTRWNPTQEQIEILEMLYKGGMRTPNAQQIEHITDRLSKHGKIEGKNVFYWFQNHKARERQKQKRNTTILGLHHSPTTLTLDTTKSDQGQQEESVYKRKYRNWTLEEDSTRFWSWSCKGDGDRTLELFPLHPEGRS